MKKEEIDESISILDFPADTLVKFEEGYKTKYKKSGVLVDFPYYKVNKEKQPNQIREALIKGYLEMSHINLAICNECLHAEYEAEYLVERLVSGG